MDFGNRLKTLRTQRKYKTFEVSEKINVSDSTYRRYERNEIAPDLNMLLKISKIYELSIEDLLAIDKVIFNNTPSSKAQNNESSKNQYSEKFIEQLELRIKEKDELIVRLNKILDKFVK